MVNSEDIYKCETVRELLTVLEKTHLNYKIDSLSFSDVYQVIDHKIKFIYRDQCCEGHYAFLYFVGEYDGRNCSTAFVEFIN